MSAKWLAVLREQRPDLAAVAGAREGGQGCMMHMWARVAQLVCGRCSRANVSCPWLHVQQHVRARRAAHAVWWALCPADQLAAEGNDESGSSSSSSSSSSSDSSSDSSSSSSSDSSEDEAAGGSGRPAAKRRRTEGGGEAAERQAGLNGVPAVREQLVGQQQAPQALAT